MTEPIRWGILGTGNIAHQFARGLADTADATLAAVGSRSAATADAFGDEFGIPRRHATYQDLASDDAIDAVYVSTPHPYHKDNSILLLEHGKAVLCEKPFTINAGEAKVVIDVARQRDVFLMEAMWTRYVPAVVRARKLINEGAIGDVRMVQADFGFRAGVNPEGRLFNPSLGGGALLDVGIYVSSFASMVLGPKPSEVVSTTQIGETGVDEQSAMLLKYPGGEIAVLSCAVRTGTAVEARIFGTDGSITFHSPFFKCDAITVKRGGDEERIELPLQGNGYNYEAAEVGRCLRADLRESDVMPLDETLALMELLDSIRAQWGLTYPME
ncbi:MAG: Gfo/Idh/MocA family oxidoreductase [Candidatus Latescibacteria bacterium]|nr:dehydrogenase [Gemmatimonadaceae bacterium]MDP6015619.1 Gfo/Idh/MocA family oxidoreductase [Candidatus Latescibacterota bacterium]MDP7447791.1 Gfo/Idh/MocA family oxidoreductase [Candidatus Latescibacterota bacterium]HJP29227.1 Gfo/Idh/MocA family oxidoreductase [Candidatus Latescibacterota bacterium]